MSKEDIAYWTAILGLFGSILVLLGAKFIDLF